MAMYYAVGKHKDCLPHRSSEQGRPSRPTTAAQQQREARTRSGLSPCGAGPAGHGGLGGELPRPPAVSGRHGPRRHGREEWARPESVRQHRNLRIITRNTGGTGGTDSGRTCVDDVAKQEQSLSASIFNSAGVG
ncbi:unnamed protein product [Ectocarpus sp. 6 AP-2014]